LFFKHKKQPFIFRKKKTLTKRKTNIVHKHNTTKDWMFGEKKNFEILTRIEVCESFLSKA